MAGSARRVVIAQWISGRPAAQVEQPGHLEYPGAGAGLAVGVIGRLPGLLGHGREFIDDVFGQGEPDRVRQPLPDDSLEEFVGAARGVRAHSILRPGAHVLAMAGQLAQRVAQHGDLVRRGVAAGIPALPESECKGSAVQQ